MTDGLSPQFMALLDLMADGDVHSGAELGDVLGVSRTAVWKQLQKLDPLGIPLESRRGLGYQIPDGIELLNEEAILEGMKPLSRPLVNRLDIYPAIESTNAKAMSVAQGDGSHGYVCLAEFQSGGRGRRGRKWVSPYGQNIYLSIVAEFTAGAAALEGLSLAVGVSVAKGLSSCGIEGVQLKWPNDILAGDKKLAGILLEMTGDPMGVCRVVIGIGVNVRASSEGMQEVDQPWVNASDLNDNLSRNRLVAAMLDELMPMLVRFGGSGFSAYRQEWEALNAHRGKRVNLHGAAQGVISGEVVGVTDQGGLVLNCQGEERVFTGGEISLRSLS